MPTLTPPWKSGISESRCGGRCADTATSTLAASDLNVCDSRNCWVRPNAWLGMPKNQIDIGWKNGCSPNRK